MAMRGNRLCSVMVAKYPKESGKSRCEIELMRFVVRKWKYF